LLKNNNATEKELITALDHCKKYESKKPLTPEIEMEFNSAFGDSIEFDDDNEEEGLL